MWYNSFTGWEEPKINTRISLGLVTSLTNSGDFYSENK
jgi:hypothetical protein